MPSTPSAIRELSTGRNALDVAKGIFASRVFGFLRQWLMARYLGSSTGAAALTVAIRIPNFLQNLLGEGAISASFIPVFSGLKSDRAAAASLAGAIFGFLGITSAVCVGLGMVFAPELVRLLAPGFQGEAQALTVELVRFTFPGVGLLVLSAWCLGILNSHRKFTLSYAAPVAWNLVMIAAVVAFRNDSQVELVKAIAIASTVGGVLQLSVQLPAVLRLLGTFNPRPSLAIRGVRNVIAGFVPAVVARGVVQVSAYVDLALASLTTAAAVAAFGYAQAIALLPVSLLGMAVFSAELPELAAEATLPKQARIIATQKRLTVALGRLAFFAAPAALALLLVGDTIAGALLESKRFGPDDTRLVWYLMIGMALALPAQTAGRLYAAVLYADGDTRTPLRIAVVRVTVGVALGIVGVRVLPTLLGLPLDVGAAFVTLASAVSAWLEVAMLRAAASKNVGATVPIEPFLPYAMAFVAGLVAMGAKAGLGAYFGHRIVNLWGGSWFAPPSLPAIVSGLMTMMVFCVFYGILSYYARLPEAVSALGAITRKRKSQ